MVTGVVAAAVGAMVELGARPDRMVALSGPAICGRCYEVAPEVANEVAAIVPSARSRTRTGTSAVDCAAGVRAQLAACGVAAQLPPSACTVESRELFSYRRDGVTGRLGGLVWLC